VFYTLLDDTQRTIPDLQSQQFVDVRQVPRNRLGLVCWTESHMYENATYTAMWNFTIGEHYGAFGE